MPSLHELVDEGYHGAMTRRWPTYFISHGGGPWPYMTGPFRDNFARLEQSLKDIAAELKEKPTAVVAITGHWEAPEFRVGSSAEPGMVYDYSGFPQHTYHVTYPAPGSPDLAKRVRDLLAGAGLPSQLDPGRGYDHGTFTPLVVMYPEADVPVVQVSIRKGYDPEAHLAAGRALAPLRDEGVLILGSGFSYHNLRQMGPAAAAPSKAFDDWLTESLVASDPAQRVARLHAWAQAPSARMAHPQEDHLLPLMVAVGAAQGEAGVRVYHEAALFGGVAASSYRFGSL